MSEDEQRSEAPDTEDEDTIRDLEVPEDESDDVKGGLHVKHRQDPTGSG
jgi:hypothetical protein